MNEWMANLDINHNEDERQSLVKDKYWFDEMMEARENVKCIMCDAYIYRKDSQRINGYIVCNECVKAHDMK